MGLFQSIFGGSKNKSTSDNQAYGLIRDNYSALMPYAKQGAQGLAAFLGGDATGFNTYKQNTGFDFMGEEGSRGITNNQAAKGLLRSGSTGTALVKFGNELQNTYADRYLQQLQGLAGLGFDAGKTITAAGQRSEATSSSTPGIAGFIGSVLGSVGRGAG